MYKITQRHVPASRRKDTQIKINTDIKYMVLKISVLLDVATPVLTGGNNTGPIFNVHNTCINHRVQSDAGESARLC